MTSIRSLASVRSYYFGEAVFIRLAGLDDHKLALSDMRPLWRKADAQAREWMRRATNRYDHVTGTWSNPK